MNDRFSSELRQHLLATANERPADGQLAAVVERVAVTGQRPSLVARLTWFPGRVGPFPSAAVRFGLVALALVLAAVVTAVIIASSPRTPSTVFEGSWTSTDPADGSAQTLVVGQGKLPDVHFVDHFATGDACVRDDVKVFTADGTGSVNGTGLVVHWPAGGGCGLTTVGMGDGTFTYREASDTIVDGQQLSWARVHIAVAPPTRGPLPAVLPTSRPATCAEIPAGATYRNDVGPLSLTVTIPAAAAFDWRGYRDAFDLSTYCLFTSPVDINASIVTSVDASCDVSTGTAVGTPAEVVTALAGAQGVAISKPTNVTLGGHAATRFEIASDARMCFDVVRLWNDDIVRRGTTTIIYVVDVGGLPLGITIGARGGETPPAQVAEAEAILASLQIGAAAGTHPTSAPAPTPDPGCIQFQGSGAYEAPAGSLSVGVTLPAEPEVYWSGLRNSFSLLRSPCQFDAPLTFGGSLVTRVPSDPCQWSGTSTDVADAAAAAAALAGQSGTETTDLTPLTIDGHAAARIEITVAEDISLEFCVDNQVGLWVTPGGSAAAADPGAKVTVYLIDVDDSILAITEMHEVGDRVEGQALLRDIDDIIGSLEIKSLGGVSG